MFAKRATFVVSIPAPEALREVIVTDRHLLVQASGGAGCCLGAFDGAVRWHLAAPAGGRIGPQADGETAVGVGADGVVTRWEPLVGRSTAVGTLPARVGAIRRVTVAPDGRWAFVQGVALEPDFHLIYGDYDRSVDAAWLWDFSRAAVAWEDRESRYEAVPPRFTADSLGLLLPPGLRQPPAWVDVASGQVRHTLACSRWLNDMRIDSQCGFALHRLPHERALACTPMDAGSRPEPAVIFAAGRGLMPLALAPDDRIAVAAAGRRLAAFDPRDGSTLGPDLVLPTRFQATCAAFALDGGALIVGSADGRVARFEVEGAGGRALAPAIASADVGLAPELGGPRRG